MGPGSAAGTLEITIRSARSLLAADRNGLSDPYVIVCLPGAPSGKGWRTKVIAKTLKPHSRARAGVERGS